MIQNEIIETKAAFVNNTEVSHTEYSNGIFRVFKKSNGQKAGIYTRDRLKAACKFDDLKNQNN